MKLTRFTEEIAAHGDFRKYYDADCVVDGILKALTIKKGSYIADPEVGSNILDYVFDLSDELTLSYIEEEVRSVISYQVNHAVLEDIHLEVTADKKAVIIQVIVSVLGETKTLKFLATKDYINLLED